MKYSLEDLKKLHKRFLKHYNKDKKERTVFGILDPSSCVFVGFLKVVERIRKGAKKATYQKGERFITRDDVRKWGYLRRKNECKR